MKDLLEQKQLVSYFLMRCNQYADDAILRYQDQPEKKATWLSYREFNLYTLKELEGVHLDSWFEGYEPSPRKDPL